MPTYNYYCKDCDEYHEVRHSMLEEKTSCIECGSPLYSRVPSIPTYLHKDPQQKERKTGDLVEEYIEKNKKSVEEERQRLKDKRKEYKG